MLLISLEKVTFSRISLEKAVKTPLCALIFLKKHPKICEIREICELSELLTKSAKSAKSASLSKLREKFAAKSASFSKLAKKLGENPREKHTRWKQPPTKLVHRRLSYKLAATYSPTLSCSTIGAHGLNCSVRNGKRCAPWL